MDLGDNMTTTQATRVLNDPEWRRVTFVRDPITRLLSAYLFLFGEVGKKTTREEWFSYKAIGLYPGASFEDFLQHLERTPPEEYDEHWKPQVLNKGLGKFMPLMDYVGSFEHLSNHTRSILEDVGLWEEYGAYGWADNVAFLQGRTQSFHSTNSSQHLSSYYTKDRLQRVEKLYKVDFDMIRSLGVGDKALMRHRCEASATDITSRRP